MTHRLSRRGVLEPAADGTPGVRFAPDCHGCGAARGARWVALGGLRARAATSQLSAGQAVLLSVREPGLVRIAAVMFGLPVCGLVLGAWAGSGSGEWSSGLFGALGFLLGLVPAIRIRPDRLVAWLGPRIEPALCDPDRPTNGPTL